MDYKFITEAEKAEIVDNQLRSLEANHFALALVEPSKFQQQDAHLQWKQQIQAIENSIKLIRSKQMSMSRFRSLSCTSSQVFKWLYKNRTRWICKS